MKKLISLALAAVMLLAIIPLSVAAETYSGECGADGNNLAWILDTATGVLTISGTGNMKNYFSENAPWYSDRSYIKSVIIEEGVTTIGAYAFYGYAGLTSVTIPKSVTYIGNYAFYGCSNLDSVHIFDMGAWCNINFEYRDANPLSCAKKLYLNNEMITSIAIPESVTSIGHHAFIGFKGLTSVSIPKSVTMIELCAFYECTGLTSVTIPESVTSIGENAFKGCTGLTSIELAEGVTRIEYLAFYGCIGLISVSIPESVTYVGNEVFSGCKNLTDIYCAAEAKPLTWGSLWNSKCNATVHWNSKAPCYGQHTPSEAADCESDQVCTVCGEVLNPAKGHTAGEWVTLEDGSQEQRCTVCGELLDTKPAPYSLGDINADGKVNQYDYILAKRAHFKTYTLNNEQAERADVNFDGVVNQYDYILLKRAHFGTYTILTKEERDVANFEKFFNLTGFFWMNNTSFVSAELDYGDLISLLEYDNEGLMLVWIYGYDYRIGNDPQGRYMMSEIYDVEAIECIGKNFFGFTEDLTEGDFETSYVQDGKLYRKFYGAAGVGDYIKEYTMNYEVLDNGNYLFIVNVEIRNSYDEDFSDVPWVLNETYEFEVIIVGDSLPYCQVVSFTEK